MQTNEKPVRKFGLRDKIGYAFGGFGNDFTFILSSSFLLKFYTDVMGVSAGLVGIMMMLARFVDAFTDVTMGQIVDRSKTTKNGKFRPWLLRMCGPVAVASLLMYASWFKDMSMGFKIFWMFFTYLLWGSVCYTGVNIPYGSMASAITGNPKERAQLSNWRTIGASFASMFISVVLPLTVYYTDTAGNKVLSGTKVSIAAVLCYLLCYHLTTERVTIETTTEKFNLKNLISSLLHNRALIGFVLASICLQLSQLTMGNMTSYVFPNYFGNTEAQAMTGMISICVIFLCSPFTVKLSDKFGRRALAMTACIISAVPLLVIYFMHTHNAWLFVVFYGIMYIGIAIFQLICWAMVTDVIDDTEVTSGQRSDGTIFAVYSFSRKIAQAASSGIIGLLLTLIGYSQATAFDAPVVEGIYSLTCLVPSIGFILSAVFLKFVYPLGKKRVDKNAAKLSLKK